MLLEKEFGRIVQTSNPYTYEDGVKSGGQIVEDEPHDDTSEDDPSSQQKEIDAIRRMAT